MRAVATERASIEDVLAVERDIIPLNGADVFQQEEINSIGDRVAFTQFLEDLEWLLLGETVKEPDKGDLVGKTKPVMGAPALAELHEIFLGQGGGTLELVAGKYLPV